MSDTRDPQSVIAAAEQAAAGGDFASAERLLREAASLQEATLGPEHPDLANTLNNLGVVCEMTGKPDEAEASFRRAYKIAKTVLEPDHPFVATSRQNLEDFCAARGTPVDVPAPPVDAPTPPVDVPAPPVDLPAPPIADIAPRSVDAPAVLVDVPVAPVAEPAPRPVVRAEPPAVPTPPVFVAPAPPARQEPRPDPGGTSRTLVIGAVVVALALVAVLAGAPWFRSNEAPATSAAPASSATPPASPAEQPATPTRPAPVDPPAAVSKAPAPPNRPPAAEARTAAGRSPALGPPPVIVEAQICKDSRAGRPGASSWKCDPPGSPVAPGPLVFYTRIKSPANATFEHRWYRDDKLRKSVELQIRANPGSGYRTYSRYTVQGPGEWRVELRTREGAVLSEERFTVR